MGSTGDGSGAKELDTTVEVCSNILVVVLTLCLIYECIDLATIAVLHVLCMSDQV